MVKEKFGASLKFESTDAKNREFPKYTTQLINIANQNSRATRSENVGQLSELVSEINPESVSEWREEYTERHPNKIEQAKEKVLEHIENLREALSKIDEEMVEEWVEDLIIEKTVSGLIIEKTIFKRLASKFNVEYTNSTPEEESKFIDGFLSGVPIQIKPESYKNTTSTENENMKNVYVVYYKETNKYITVFYEQELERVLRRQ